MARRIALLLVLGLSATLGLLAVAAPASAHAVVVSSSPADGAVLARAPARVTVTFDEPVGVSSDSLRVFAPDGGRVDTGGTRHGQRPQQITVALRTGLGRGTYTVAWHVISADSHPVQGAYTFSIGAPSHTVVTPASLRPPASPLVGAVFGIVRWLAFCCFAILAGAVAFVIWCWPAGADRPQVLRLIMGAWGGLAFSVLAAMLLQGVYGADQGMGHVFWPNVLHATLYSRYGRAIGARLLLVIVALFVFSITLGSLPAGGRRARIVAGTVWGTLTAAMAATWAVADHAGTGSQVLLAVPADIIHLSAMALWLGGLAMLVTIVLRRPQAAGRRFAAGWFTRFGLAGTAAGQRGQPGRATRQRGQVAGQRGQPAWQPGRATRQQGQTAGQRGPVGAAEAAQAVMRFSPLALTCVVVIVITGTYMAWRNVGTLGALTGTTYGRLLVLKITGLCVLVGLGYLARRRIAEGLQATTTAIQAAVVTMTAPARVKAGAARAGQARGGASLRPGQDGAGTGAPAGRGGAGNGMRPGAGARTAKGVRPGTGARPGLAGAQATETVGSADDGALRNGGLVGVTLRRLRWSVAIETVIAAAVLAVTAVLVNTPTGRESYFPPATAAAAFDTGGPGGRGSMSLTVTPAKIGSNQFRITITGSTGKPYRPQQVEAALWLPARNLGPLAIALTPDGPGRYLGRSAAISTTGQWQLRITIRSDAFDEANLAVPFSIH